MKIQLGAIVTNMAGSAGGQSVRRYRGGHVLQNKPMYTANQRVYQNARIGQTSETFRSWQLLSYDEQNQWTIQANNYQFIDKFGNNVKYTGRMFYTSLTLNTQFAEIGAPDISSITSYVPGITLDAADFSSGTGQFPIQVTGLLPGMFVVISVAQVRYRNSAVSIKRASKIMALAAPLAPSIDIYIPTLQKYGSVYPGTTLMVVATPFNSSGFKGAPQVIYRTVEP